MNIKSSSNDADLICVDRGWNCSVNSSLNCFNGLILTNWEIVDIPRLRGDGFFPLKYIQSLFKNTSYFDYLFYMIFIQYLRFNSFLHLFGPFPSKSPTVIFWKRSNVSHDLILNQNEATEANKANGIKYHINLENQYCNGEEFIFWIWRFLR